MLVMYAVGIPTAFDFLGWNALPQSIAVHFVVSVAVSGSPSPWMYINLRKIYEEPMKTPIETLSSIRIASASASQASVSYAFVAQYPVVMRCHDTTRSRRCK